MPSEIRPSSERGRNENDRRSQLGNPEKRPQKTSTVRGFGSGTAGRHHLRFMDTVPSSSQAREQIEYNRHIQKVLAERNGKTLPHCEVQLGHREGLRGGTPEEAEAYRNSLSVYGLEQSYLAQQGLPNDGGDAILAEYRSLYNRPAENQQEAGSSRQADIPDSRQEQIEELVRDLRDNSGYGLQQNSRIRQEMRENIMTASEYKKAKEYIKKIEPDKDKRRRIMTRVRQTYSLPE